MKIKTGVKLFIFFLCLLSEHRVWAQASIPIGTWRTHFSYQQINQVVAAGDQIYCASQNGLFYFDRKDNSLNILSKTNGFSDAGIAAMAYEPSSAALLIAYRSGTLDLFSKNRVASFTLIRDHDSGEQINHIYFSANIAYLSTSQGVRVLEVSTEGTPRIEIRESYTNLSQTGDKLTIFSSTMAHDSLFLATEGGMIAAPLNAQTNRQDFRNWRRFSIAQGIPAQPIHFVASLADQVYAGLDKSGLYRYENGAWQLTEVKTSLTFDALHAGNDELVMVLGGTVVLYDRERMTTLKDALITQTHDAVMDEQGTLWIGDHGHGLIRGKDNAFTNFYPEGPASDSIAELKYLQGNIIVLKKEPLNGTGAFYVFDKGKWVNYESGVDVPTTAPLLDVVYDATSKNYYFASFGAGIMQWDGAENFTLINADSNGNTLQNNQITALTLNSERTLWVTNFNASTALHAFNLSDKTWQGFPAGNRAEASYPLKMIGAEDGNLWILLNDNPLLADAGKDILVFDPEKETSLFLKDAISGAQFPGASITDLVRDKNGQIWIGGNEGVAYFPDPWNIFSEVNMVKPIFGNQFLLLGEYTTSIAVDGGNRKWIGTRNGLWLFDEAGETLISNFTTENSPLISNVILDISVNDADGEVFIATDRGLVSYRGTATAGTPEQQSVKIFPNPVLSDFSGLVGIEGLVAGATVKITSISGSLVRQLAAEGGTATWDVRDYRGSRVGTGIYLVFSASVDGQETFVGKVAIID